MTVDEEERKWSQIYPEREVQRFELNDSVAKNLC
jgi:hypothetical protein